MATPATPEAIEIRRRGRRRLIGAIAIVILLVVFVPMILDSEQRAPHSDPSLEIPKKDSAPPLPTPTPGATRPSADAAPTADKGAPEQPSSTPPAKAVDAAPATAGSLESKQVAPKGVAKPEPAAAPKASTADAASSKTPAQPELKGFAVQVGAFRDEAKLKQAREKLAALHISHYVERHGDLNRLRAGPFATREAAEKALASIKAASLQGQVVPLP